MPNYPDFDPVSNPSDNTPFPKVVAERYVRRQVLGGGVAAATGFLGVAAGVATPAAASGHRHQGWGGRLLGFDPVPASDEDTVTVPAGYTVDVVLPWGMPLQSTGPEWQPDASNTAAEQVEQVGMHHDGMHYFPLGKGREGSSRGLLVVNHEYVDRTLVYPDGDAEMTPEKVEKALAAHGVSVVEIALVDGAWQVADSDYNHRVHGTTPNRPRRR